MKPTYTLHKLILGSALLTTPALNAAEWTLNNNGTWETNATPPWNTGSFPNAVDAVADFSKINITGNRNVTLGGPITIGSLNLGDNSGTSRYQFGGPGILTFQTSSGNASLTKTTGGTDYLDMQVVLNSNLDVNIASGRRVEFLNTPAVISGSGNINKTGSGNLILGGGGTNATHSYTGTLNINEGRVMARNEANLGPGNISLNGGILTYYWGASMTRSLGAGQNQIQFTGGTTGLSMNGNNGLTTDFAGISQVVWGSTFFNPDTLVLQGDQTQLNAVHRWLDGVDLNGAVRTIEVSTAVTGGNNRAEMEGVITGSGGIIKVGNSKLQLEAANNYTGITEIREGTLSLTGAGSIGSSSILIGAGATFDSSAVGGHTVASGNFLSGNGTIAGNIVLDNGANLSPGNSPGTLTFSNDLMLNAASTYEFDGVTHATDLVVVDGQLTLTDGWILALGSGLTDGGSVTIFEYDTLGTFGSADFDISNLGFVPTSALSLTDTGSSIVLNGVSMSVPEPSTTALLGLGGLALILRRRR